MIELFKLKYIRTTKHNVIYYSDTHVWIFNTTTKGCNIKPRL